jgi:hypothetical protein
MPKPHRPISLDGVSLTAAMPADTTQSMPCLAALASIEALRSTLAMARALVEGGRMVDLAGLDADAAIICRTLEGLPNHAARAMRPAILSLIREVEALAILMPGE